MNEPVKPALSFCIALVSAGVLVAGCAISQTAASRNPDRLYLHLFASFEHPRMPELIASVPIPATGNFDIPINNSQHLRGSIERRQEKIHLSFGLPLCSGSNVFDGEVELEKRYEPWPQPYDANAPYVCQPHFVLSSSSSPKLFLKQQTAA